MTNRIKTGDLVKVISGQDKGKTGKVAKIDTKKNLVFVEGLGNRERHMHPSMYRPGGKKDIQIGFDASKVALVVNEKSGKTSRIGYAKDKDGKSVRIARQDANKEIK